MHTPLILYTVLLLMCCSVIATCQVIDDITMMGLPLTEYLGHNLLDKAHPNVCQPQIWSPDGTYTLWVDSLNNVNMVFHASGEAMTVYRYNQFVEEIDAYKDYHVALSNPIHSLACSPDSRTIALTQSYYDSTKGAAYSLTIDEEKKVITGLSLTNQSKRIVMFTIETGESDIIADGYDPCWSPDGRYLAYKTFDYRIHTTESQEPLHNGELTYYDTITGETVLTGIVPDPSPVFSVDSQSIYYGTHENGGSVNGSSHIFRLPLDGSEPEEICAIEDSYFKHFQSKLSLSPDGNWLAMLRRTKGREKASSDPKDIATYYVTWIDRIVLLNLETYRLYELFEPDQVERIRFFDCQFSHDSSRLCFYAEEYKLREDFAYKQDDSCKKGYFVTEFTPSALFLISPPYTAVAEDTPASFMTVQNFPNPFNPTTMVSFSIPEAGFTEVAIYTVTAQKVRTLVAGELSAGTHQMVWDGCDDQGTPVSSGVFVSQLSSGGTVVTNRMTLVR